MTRVYTRAAGPLATLVALRQAAVLALSAMLVLALSPLNTDALAQGRRTGTVRGNVTDAQGLVMPGVTVNLSSPAMQGRRSTFTDLNGNYEALGLPPGEYDVVFELDGFADVENMATVPLGATIEVNGSMTPGGVTETVQVVAVVPSPIATTESSSNTTADEISALPVGRTPFRIAELQPGLTNNTPNAGQVTVNGSFAYDNIFLMDGVDINDNLFGTANNLFIEDAIEETQVLTSGISAEYGRFSGGVINMITKSGGNTFSGSFRSNLYKPQWTKETPFEVAAGNDREGNLKDNTTYETTVGGPIVQDRLWFFYANRIQREAANATLPQTAFQYDRTTNNDRNQFKLTGTIAPGHTLAGSYLRNQTNRTRSTFSFSIDPITVTDQVRPNDLYVMNYRGAVSSNIFVEAQYSRRKFSFGENGGTSLDIFDSPFITLTQSLGHYNAPYFDATDPEDRKNQQFSGSLTYFASTPAAGTHSIKVGGERFTSSRVGGNSQSSTSYVFDADYAVGLDGSPLLDGDGRLQPVFVPGATLIENWIPVRGATIDINTTSFYVNDDWTINNHLSANIGVRGEIVDSNATGNITTVDTSAVTPRLGLAYDPVGDGQYTIQTTYSHYSGKYSESQFANNTNVGNPDFLFGVYTGPAGQGRDFAPGFDTNNYFTFFGLFPTRSVFNDDSLKSPVTKEFTVSAGSTLGTGGHIKATYIKRSTDGFVEDFFNLAGGQTTIIENGQNFGTFDNQIFRNSDGLERNYDAIQLDGRYRVTGNFLIDGSYTGQINNEGNFEGEATNQPGIGSTAFDFPEITPEARHFPFGRLDDFQRHKARIWGIYNVGLGGAGSVDVGGIWRYNSGLTYSLASTGQSATATQAALVSALGYAGLPPSRTIYYGGGRGSENFEGYGLFDLSVQYQIPVWESLRPWFKAELYNVFNNDKLIGFNTSVTPDTAGPVDALGIPTTFINDANFGQAESVDNFPQYIPGLDGGRTFQMALGFRF